MNGYLTGEEGIKTLLKNDKGAVLQMVDYIKPDVGSRVELTIDSRVQCLVENTPKTCWPSCGGSDGPEHWRNPRDGFRSRFYAKPFCSQH